MEELLKRQSGEKSMLESKIAALTRPRLGTKPIPSAQAQLQGAAMREELREKQEGELKQMQAYLEFLSTQEAAAAPLAADVCAPPAELADIVDEDVDDDDASIKKTKAQRRRVRAHSA
jgi:hypothetical protein